MLLGVAEPGGRLPTTWPATLEDVPVINVTPTDGEVSYDEGIHIGYRAWLKAGVAPAYEFGFGLGYTTFGIADASVSSTSVAPGDGLQVSVSVTNTGARTGKQVVQVYASRGESTIDRPVRWLVGYATVTLDAGVTQSVTVTVPGRSFSHWAEGWAYEAGEFTLSIGTSVSTLPLSISVNVQ
jgi:beta-glucosidase